jgi:hypothetical protein
MTASVHYLHDRPEPIGQFLRTGSTGHRQLETLHSAARLPVERVVVEAASIDVQKDLIHTLREDGVYIVLDTNVAELSALGRYQGAGKCLPWADQSRPLVPEDFLPPSDKGLIRKIARFATKHEVHAVLAPTQLVETVLDTWFRLDIRLCEALRKALDAEEGGKNIAIDYPLLTTYGALRDSAQRRAFVADLRSLPFDNLWLRISGFGSDASPAGVRRYISALFDFHALGKPVVADCIGGLAGLAVSSFGASGAIAHGVAEKERFDAGSWNAPRRSGGGGQSGRVYIPGLDRMMKIADAKKLLEARGARRLISCPDRHCCPLGAEDMFKDAKGHFLTQRHKQISDLSRVPERHRVDHFLDRYLAAADRVARQVARLNTGDDAISASLQQSSLRLDRMRSVLEDLHRTIGDDASRSATPRRRGETGRAAAGRTG